MVFTAAILFASSATLRDWSVSRVSTAALYLIYGVCVFGTVAYGSMTVACRLQGVALKYRAAATASSPSLHIPLLGVVSHSTSH